MAFDPDAYLARNSPATTPAAGAFDPDAYLARNSPAAPPTPTPKPPERSTWQTIKDGLNVPRDVIARGALGAIAAPVGDIAGLAATGYEAVTKGGKGDGEMPGRFREAVKRKITSFAPDNSLLSDAGRIAAPVGQAVANFGTAVKDAAKGGAANDTVRGAAVNAGAEAAKQSLNFIGLKGAQAAPEVIDAVRGVPAVAARKEALSATRSALDTMDESFRRKASDIDLKHEARQREANQHFDSQRGQVDQHYRGVQREAMTEAQAYEDAATRTQAALDAAARRQGVPRADALGEQVRSSYVTLMDQAKAARKAATDPLYAKAQEAAAAREATGARVDIKPAVADIKKMLELSENLPDLQAKLQRLREAVEGSTPKQPVPAPVGKVVQAKAARVATPPAPGLTYDQLALANRYIKDIAFAGEAEGYSATIRNTAKKLSMDLDRQISAFVPEHDAAQAAYRKLSEPMETLTTRYGQAIRDTEGGLKDEAYARVPAQDLPGRIFGKREGIEQLVDALAGGKTASAEARAAAQARVDTWVENWILDAKRGKIGDAARVEAPGQRAALNAAPGASQRLERTWGSEQQQAVRVPELRDAAKQSRAEGERAATERTSALDRIEGKRASKQESIAGKTEVERKALEGARLRVRQTIERADLDLQHGSVDAAYKGYVEALRQNMAVADPERYKAAIALIDRAEKLEEKTKRARRLAMGVAGLVGVGAAARIGVQVPGVMQ